MEADLIRIEQGVFERPTAFKSWISVCWIKPNAGATGINVFLTVVNGISVDFRQDGVNKTATTNGSVFGASFGTNNGKAMTEIEVIITDGVNTRSYYLDVCLIDTQRHDVGVQRFNAVTLLFFHFQFSILNFQFLITRIVRSLALRR